MNEQQAVVYPIFGVDSMDAPLTSSNQYRAFEGLCLEYLQEGESLYVNKSSSIVEAAEVTKYALKGYRLVKRLGAIEAEEQPAPVYFVTPENGLIDPAEFDACSLIDWLKNIVPADVHPIITTNSPLPDTPPPGVLMPTPEDMDNVVSVTDAVPSWCNAGRGAVESWPGAYGRGVDLSGMVFWGVTGYGVRYTFEEYDPYTHDVRERYRGLSRSFIAPYHHGLGDFIGSQSGKRVEPPCLMPKPSEGGLPFAVWRLFQGFEGSLDDYYPEDSMYSPSLGYMGTSTPLSHDYFYLHTVTQRSYTRFFVFNRNPSYGTYTERISGATSNAQEVDLPRGSSWTYQEYSLTYWFVHPGQDMTLRRFLPSLPVYVPAAKPATGVLPYVPITIAGVILGLSAVTPSIRLNCKENL